MIEFLLGAAIITLIYQGVKLNQLSKQTKTLEEAYIKACSDSFKDNYELSKRIDQETDRTDRLHNDAIEYVNQTYFNKTGKKKLLKG